MNPIRATAMVVILSAACFAREAGPADVVQDVELAAARHMLALYRGAAVVIDSGYARAEDAPGHPTGRTRPATRSAALSAALGATVGTAVPNGGVHLILSEPAVSGDSARVTITVQWKGGPDWRAGRSGYHTQALVVVHEGDTWRVVEVVDLGIS